MKKKIAAIMAVLVMVCALPMTSVHAEPELDEVITETIVEEYSYTDKVTSILSFSGSTATCTSSVKGKNTCTKIVATQKLQKKTTWGWSNVETWNETVYDKNLTMTNTKTVTESGTYRVRIEAKVYSDSKSENVYANSANKTK